VLLLCCSGAPANQTRVYYAVQTAGWQSAMAMRGQWHGLFVAVTTDVCFGFLSLQLAVASIGIRDNGCVFWF